MDKAHTIYWTQATKIRQRVHLGARLGRRKAMASEATFLIAQFLDWVERKPRRHADVREAWSSTCPLNCAWEDAISQDLVHYDGNGFVSLTERGRMRLAVGRTSEAQSAKVARGGGLRCAPSALQS
jgi:hypothetical protein